MRGGSAAGAVNGAVEAIWLLQVNGFVVGAVLPVDDGHRPAAP